MWERCRSGPKIDNQRAQPIMTHRQELVGWYVSQGSYKDLLAVCLAKGQNDV